MQFGLGKIYDSPCQIGFALLLIRNEFSYVALRFAQ